MGTDDRLLSNLTESDTSKHEDLGSSLMTDAMLGANWNQTEPDSVYLNGSNHAVAELIQAPQRLPESTEKIPEETIPSANQQHVGKALDLFIQQQQERAEYLKKNEAERLADMKKKAKFDAAQYIQSSKQAQLQLAEKCGFDSTKNALKMDESNSSRVNWKNVYDILCRANEASSQVNNSGLGFPAYDGVTTTAYSETCSPRASMADTNVAHPRMFGLIQKLATSSSGTTN